MNFRHFPVASNLAVVLLAVCASMRGSAQSSEYEACFEKSTPMTREQATCRIRRFLRYYETEIRRILEHESDLEPGEINDVIREMNIRRAECEVAAVFEFAATRSDIPLHLLVSSATHEYENDEDIIWLNQQTGLEPLTEELNHCEDQYFGSLNDYVADP